MIKYIFLLLPQFAFALSLSPTPFPVFLKSGYSTILEFEEPPTKVVLGDSQSFQVEKLDRSIVIKTRTSYATSNMFVYFKTKEPKLFILTASEEAEPTYYKKFESILPAKPTSATKPITFQKGAKLISAQFTPKKDFLTVEIEVTADSQNRILPQWEKVRLIHNKNSTAPEKLWSERKEIQKDSNAKARFVFSKPNLQRNLKDTKLIVPLAGVTNPFVISLAGRIK